MNIKRSKAFFKVKRNILASKNLEHTGVCKDMIIVANGLLDKDEIVILKEYLREKEKEFEPVSEKEGEGSYSYDEKSDYEEDSQESLYHRNKFKGATIQR